MLTLLEAGDTLYQPLLAVAALTDSRSRSRASHSTHSPGYEFRCEAARSRLRISRSSATLHAICRLGFTPARTFAGDGAIADVAAILHSWPMDLGHTRVGEALRFPYRLP